MEVWSGIDGRFSSSLKSVNVIIIGLRRSGTTAFWGMWRQDVRVACYNEPFNAQLSRVGEPEWEGARFTGREFAELYRRDPARFWHHYAPIPRHGELQDDLSDQQARWLGWLQSSADHTCIDVTRCHYKLASLRELDPEAIVVHLYRPPANWVTSVVQPSTTHFRRKSSARIRWLRTAQANVQSYRFRQAFWTARNQHRFKGFEELIGRHSGTSFGIRLAEAGMDPAAVYAMPDVGRLLAFWKLHYEHVEREGPRLFGDRFVSVNFNDFCRAPLPILSDVYRRAGLGAPAFDVSGIHPPPSPFAATDPRWSAYAERLGLPALS